LVKTSLLDFPGEVVAVIFTPGCNLRCPWCQNPALVSDPFPEELVSREEVLAHLTRRRDVLGGVVVTGGEPLFQQDLIFLLEEIKALGYRIKLDTNGTYPRRLARIPEKLVDFVAMDLKAAPERYHLMGIPGMGAKIRESVSLIQRRYPRREFRTTWVPDLNVPEEIPDMAAVLGEGEKLVLTGFRPGETLDPRFRAKRAPTQKELLHVKELFRSRGVRARLRSESMKRPGRSGVYEQGTDGDAPYVFTTER
jgi:pyruvate formate lyase activating enzyme